jgi:peptidoglycan L-alanyl-D-glutamate endopeptidase CwlK
MIGELDTLHPAFRLAIERILSEMRNKGWDPVIGSGMRTNEEQDALYAQGRKPLKNVNALRKGVGWHGISKAANKGTVTNAKGGQSNHNKRHSLIPHGKDAVDVAVGYAVDIVDKHRGWEAKAGFWTDLGRIAKKNGCAWGGDWKKPDVAHVEMKLIDSAPRTEMVV